MISVFSSAKKRETAQESSRYVDQMKGLYNESIVISDQLVAAVDEVDQTMVQLSTIADQTQQQEQTLTNCSMQATSKINEAFSSLQEVTAASDQISSASMHLTEQSAGTKQVTLEMQQSLTETEQLMKHLKQNNLEMTKQIEHLIEQTSKIYEMNNLIQQIVSQTSLLALNASIEAAHAGEYGRGFAVVAQEIRRLADQSNDTVKQSTELVTQIERGVKLVTDAVEQERSTVERSVEEMGMNRERMDLITERIVEVDQLVNEMKESSANQTEQTAYVTERLQEAVEYVNETLTAVQDTVNMNESQRNQITKLDRIRSNMGKASNDLKKAISLVEIDVVSKVTNSSTEAIMSWLTAAAQTRAIRSLDPSIHREELKALLNKQSEVEAIWSNYADGSFIVSIPDAGLLNAKNREWWQRARSGDSFKSSYYVSAITKQLCQTLSVPIYNEENVIVGVLGIDLTIKN
ncbi:methyl-accepting chemotaxis protein [Paenibacillus septentrionalis]|uniref:Methyl-accepting chemotaxis protein n=1 Tax=Paenibacillus septentrionalis TaxID=429342 RepID=A0ABW1V7D2_9BACL